MIARALKGKLLVFGVFFLGVASGALGVYSYEARVRAERYRADREMRANRDVNQFHEYLGLNSEQREQVRKIMEDARAEFRNLAEQTRPQYEAIRELTRTRVRSVLSEEQRKRYDDFNQKTQQRMQQRGQRR
jgi:hypothetical protein